MNTRQDHGGCQEYGDRQGAGRGRRPGQPGRARGATMLLGLLLGLAWVVMPASAQADVRLEGMGRSTATAGTASIRTLDNGTAQAAAGITHTSYAQGTVTAQARPDKPKKKTGFFKKLGIALLIVLIVIILIIVLLIWLLVRAVKRIFSRRRS
ncbi:hypothetical protein AB0G73_00785 [Streptomyces sp. NPDC020719]|uniref:hypothetical protein n=1 Tax=Streptomyces sp. NPDC020719 TaxID=3154896 RepID=UPI0033ECAC84